MKKEEGKERRVRRGVSEMIRGEISKIEEKMDRRGERRKRRRKPEGTREGKESHKYLWFAEIAVGRRTEDHRHANVFGRNGEK